MSERIERYAVVNDDGRIVGFYPTLQCAEDARRGEWSSYRIIRLTEIRDSESIAVNGDTVREWSPMAPWSVVDEARRERDAAIEHALTAERRLDAKINELRGLHVEVKELRERAESMEASRDAIKRWGDEWRDRALSAESQLNDAAAKFERWAAVKFRAVFLAHGDGDFSELDEARKLRSHYFPPAKEVSNG